MAFKPGHTFWGTAEERFFKGINKPDGESGCWLWQGVPGKNGYGYIGDGGRQRLVHRWSYEHFVGPIPEGLELDHLCRVRICANPAHLEPVTKLVNIQRGEWAERAAEEQRAKTHCKHGHAYTEENTYLWHGERQCRECARIRARKRGHPERKR